MTDQANPRPESLDDVFKQYAHVVVVDDAAPIDAFCATIKAMDVPEEIFATLLFEAIRLRDFVEQAYEFSSRARTGER